MEKKTLGVFIAALRKANGMTQQELADRLNVSNKAVSRWERDECAPDLSLIPALAEIFGVTCDELLKGERIFTEPPHEKSEPKVEKQLKCLINRTISSFKTLLWISFALSAVGLVCMFGISYGFFRPVIGFSVMLLFETAALVLTAIGVNKMKETKRENELFEHADVSQINKYNRVLGKYSYIAYFAIVSVVALSLPLLLFLPQSVGVVLTFESYFACFGIIAPALLLVFLGLKDLYFARITEQPYRQTFKKKNPGSQMNALQLGAIALSSVIYVIYPYFQKPNGSLIIENIVYLSALGLMAADIVLFIVYWLRFKTDRNDLVLPGIRNMLLTIPAFLMQRSHSMVFYMYDITDTAYERYEIWDAAYLWLALGMALFIFALFKLIEVLIEKKKTL